MTSLRPYFINVPGEGQVETYPSVSERLLKNGFEKIVISVSDEVLSYLARTSHLPHMAKRILAEIYPISPPIDPRDIIAPFIDFEDNLIGYSIRRGHFYLSDFFREHDDPCFTGKQLTCSCHPGETFPIHLSSFPTYLMEENHG